jgi:hypothetical protein
MDRGSGYRAFLCFVKSVVTRSLFGAGFLVGLDEGMLGFVAGVVAPVGLHEDGVDLFEPDRAGLVADGFDQGTDTEVFDGPQVAFGGAQDELDGFFGEGGGGQADEVELLVDVVGEGGLSDEDWKRMSFQKTRLERSDRSLST